MGLAGVGRGGGGGGGGNIGNELWGLWGLEDDDAMGFGWRWTPGLGMYIYVCMY